MAESDIKFAKMCALMTHIPFSVATSQVCEYATTFDFRATNNALLDADVMCH